MEWIHLRLADTKEHHMARGDIINQFVKKSFQDDHNRDRRTIMEQNQAVLRPAEGKSSSDMPHLPNPSKLCAWLAAAVPVLVALCGLIGFLLFAFTTRSEGSGTPLLELWIGMPILDKIMFLVVPVISVVGCTVLLALSGYGKRIPVVLLLGLAALPWISGNACTLFFSRNAMEAFKAIGDASGDSLGVIAAGLGETLISRMIGSFQAGLFLAACGIGLGVAAIGQRAAGRRLVSTSALLASSLPVLVFVPGWILYTELGSAGLMPILMAVGIVVAAILVGLGTGASSPNERNWPLGFGALVSAGMALLAGAAFCSAWTTVDLFANMAVTGSSNVTSLTAAAATLGRANQNLWLASGGLALLPVLVLGVWAFSQARIRPAWLIGAAACLVLVAGILVLDRFPSKANPGLIQEILRQTTPRSSPGSSPGPQSQLEPAPPLGSPTQRGSDESGRLQAPVEIPFPGEEVSGLEGGVPGGVVGGSVGGVGTPSATTPSSRKGKASPAEPVPLSGEITPPKLVTQVPPVYPPLARKARIQGIVILQAIVDQTGHVSSVRVISGHPLLNSAAVDAVSKWVYEPAQSHGKPIPVIMTVTVRFVE
jgi:TonB family protein